MVGFHETISSITNITEMVEMYTEIKIMHSYIHSVVIVLKILHRHSCMHI